jgi:phosphate acyltransferase
MKTIALDAMGGDNAPVVEVEGAIAAARAASVRVVLVGHERRLRAELRQRGAGSLPIEVHPASQVITMHDAPSAAVRRKKDASMRVAANLLRDGEVDAVVSAGNSGAMMACGLFVLKRQPGVDRPAILTTFPTTSGQAALLDMGANVECRPINLVQFAVMGAAFASTMHDKKHPRVGLLSNGAEEHKGTQLTRETHRLLEQGPTHFDYRGYVEGRDIFSGAVDVIVCDGFSGNLVLKVTEGVAETLASFLKQSIRQSIISKLAALALLPAFNRVKARMDYAEQGGAPLLGVDGVSIICHGGSNSKAIKNAIIGAGRFVDRGLPQVITRSVEAHEELIAAAKRPVGQRPLDVSSERVS